MKQFYIALLVIILSSVGVVAQSSDRKVADQKSEFGVAPVLTVTAPTQVVPVATSQSLVIKVTDTTGAGILGYRGELTYDPTVLQTLGGQAGCTTIATISSGFSCFGSETVINPTTRKIIFFTFGSTPLAGAGDLVRFNFQVIGAAGTFSPLTFTDFFFNEGGPTDPGDITVNGLITVVSATAADVSISGKVEGVSGRGIAKARVSVRDGAGNIYSAISNSFGYFQIYGVPTGGSFILTTSAKNYEFPSEVINVNEQITGLIITGMMVN